MHTQSDSRMCFEDREFWREAGELGYRRRSLVSLARRFHQSQRRLELELTTRSYAPHQFQLALTLNIVALSPLDRQRQHKSRPTPTSKQH